MNKKLSDIAQTANEIRHWSLLDQEHDDFVIGLEAASRHSGKNCAFIKSLADDTSTEKTSNACGHLIQRCGIPAEFRSNRVRMTAWVRSALLAESIGRLELDVIGKWGWYCKWNGTYDNMSDRPIRGATDWQQYSLVVDVPEESISIYFGLSLIGSGKMWLDELNFEVVDKTVSLTGLIDRPQNLDFSE